MISWLTNGVLHVHRTTSKNHSKLLNLLRWRTWTLNQDRGQHHSCANFESTSDLTPLRLLGNLPCQPFSCLAASNLYHYDKASKQYGQISVRIPCYFFLLIHESILHSPFAFPKIYIYLSESIGGSSSNKLRPPNAWFCSGKIRNKMDDLGIPAFMDPPPKDTLHVLECFMSSWPMAISGT